MKNLIFFALLLFLATSASASSVTMEIFYLPHRPALAVVEKIEQSVAELGYVSIEKYSFDDQAAMPLLEKYQLLDHMPVAVVINGKDRYPVDGKEIIFRNFPKGDAFVPNFEGGWSYEDLKRIVVSLHGQ
jgi:hypothetical protein